MGKALLLFIKVLNALLSYPLPAIIYYGLQCFKRFSASAILCLFPRVSINFNELPKNLPARLFL